MIEILLLILAIICAAIILVALIKLPRPQQGVKIVPASPDDWGPDIDWSRMEEIRREWTATERSGTTPKA